MAERSNAAVLKTVVRLTANRGFESLFLRRRQEHGNKCFCLFSLRGFEPRSASDELASGAGNPSFSAEGKGMGISAFAFFNCVGSNPGAPATSSRAERAIPLSPHRAKVRNWDFCLFSLLGFEPRSASDELASGASNPSFSAEGKSMGISAFAFFCFGGSNRGAPATSSRAERAIPLSPQKARAWE